LTDPAPAPAAADEGAAPRFDSFELRFLLMLSFTAGVFDATAFIGLDSVFVANMTGNVVLVGLGLTAPGLTVSGPLVAIGAFVIGAALAARSGLGARTRLQLLQLTLVVEGVLLVPAILLAIGYDGGHDLTRLLIIAALAAAMGSRNETMREIGVPEIATTAQTVRLATIAGEEFRGGGRGPAARRRIGAVVAMLAGAIVGGWLAVETDLVWPLVLLLTIHLVSGAGLIVRGRGSRHA